jgi:hypothetical protein
MYAWIWRHLPFGRPGKLLGSLLLISLTGALLWYVVFPWAEPLLPFDDVQVTESGVPGGSDDTGPIPGPDGSGDEPASGDGHDLPYATNRNNPPPTPTPRR